MLRNMKEKAGARAVTRSEAHLHRPEQCGSETSRGQRIFEKEIRERPRKNEHVLSYGMRLLGPGLEAEEMPPVSPVWDQSQVHMYVGFIPKEITQEGMEPAPTLDSA